MSDSGTEGSTFPSRPDEAERYLATLVQQSDDAIMSFTADGRIISSNRGAERIFGYTEAEFRQQHVSALVPPDRAHEPPQLFQRVMSGESISHYETVRRKKDGTPVDVSITLSPLRNASEKIVAVIGTVRDITEQKRQEVALRDSEAKLRLITDSVPTMISFVDAEQRYQFNNAAYEPLFGVPREKLLGRPIQEFLSEEAYRTTKPRIEAVLRGVPQQFENQLINSKGEYAHYLVQFMPEKDRDGRVRGFYSLVTDVSHVKQAEQALRENEQRLNLALGAGHMGTWDWDLSKDLTVWSDEFFHLLGLQPGDVTPSYDGWIQRVHREDRELVEKVFADARAAEDDYHFEVRVQWPDDSTHWTEGRGRFYHDDHGNTVRMCGVFVAIDRRKQAEEQLRQRDSELAYVTRVSTMGEMATAIAHELTQPLSTIANYAGGCIDLIEKQNARPAEVLDTLRRVHDQILRMGDIIRRLKTFVTKSITHSSLFNVIDAIIEVEELLAGETIQYQSEILHEFGEETLEIKADRIQIQQVLMNLLQNAMEASTSSDPQLRQVILRTSRGDGVVEVAVVDRGSGISEKDFDQVFEPYFTTKPNGMGMGLAICRTIIQNHGGRIWAEANRGGGTTFHVTLPEAPQERVPAD